jgi:hypothetical protein
VSVGLRTYIAHGNCPLDGQAANANGKKRPDICAGPDVWWSQGVPLWIRSESASTQDICDLAPNNCAATSPPEIPHNQQVDFHVAFGLNHNSPSYTLGVGYSFRVDTLFAAK